MENEKTSVNNDEIVYYSARASYGVFAKNLKSPRNIYKSFSPLSSNQKVSFCNTIMIPFIKTESSIESNKADISIKSDTLTDEYKNVAAEKPITKILVENETDRMDEITNDGLEHKIIENKERKDSLEINPFFLGGQCCLDLIPKDEPEVEMRKINKLLNLNQNEMDYIDENIHIQTSKDMNQKLVIEDEKNNSDKKVKRIRTISVNDSKGSMDLENKEIESLKRSKLKYKTDLSKLSKDKRKINKKTKSFNKHKNSYDTNGNIRKDKIKLSSFGRATEKTFKDKELNIKNRNDHFHENKEGILIKNSTPKLKLQKMNMDHDGNFPKFKLASDKGLKTDFNLGTKERKKSFHRKEEQRGHFLLNKRLTNKYCLNFLNSAKTKKYKSLAKEFVRNEKKKISKKFSETIKKFDFESELKNKNNLVKTQYNLFSPNKFTNTQFCGSDYLDYTLDCMELILKSNKAQKQIKNKINFNFPKIKGNKIQKKIALFDLDETLVHCTGDINLKNDKYQHCVEVILPGNKKTKVGINMRPLWKKTLNLIRKYYHIVVFTASHQAYADAVLNYMDPSNKYFKYRLYRNNCTLVDVEGDKFYVKDLDIFDEYYNLKDIVIVDNSVLSFIYHLENGIPIVPYYNEDKDGSLYVVGLYLLHIYQEDDLREANKKYINLDSFLNEAKLRNDTSSVIIEESNKEINCINNDNNKKNLKEIATNKVNKGKIQKKISINSNYTHLTYPRRFSMISQHDKNKLKCQSKLIDMYYQIKDNKYATDKKRVVEIVEGKSNKSFSIEDEEIKENKSYKNIFDLFYEKRPLTTENIHVRNQSSKNNKIDCLNTKMIRSNFINKFSDRNLPIHWNY